MATDGNSQRVQDYDWETALNDKHVDPETDAGGAAIDPGAGAPAQAAKKPASHQNLDLLLDIPLEITAELGRAKMIINDLLQLGQGSVIELNKLAGEPLEIMVNQKLIARGEVVVVNEKFGIRLTDVISPLERIKQLT
ncbi:MAG: flagellar motor switch protein FliN [Deltaproteobacteria bacterium]|nr:flagellar motor switch protein FliN [Deltaproteobacteria bacterium]MBI4795655.1 flagellar motor switch protein FliN [Deltaproteobacteria bacterium]